MTVAHGEIFRELTLMMEALGEKSGSSIQELLDHL